MDEPLVLIDRDTAGLAVLTLNRPQALNALSSGLMTALGGLGHTLPYLIPNFWTATTLALISLAYPAYYTLLSLYARLIAPRVQGWVDNPRGVHLDRYLAVTPR